MRRVERDEFAAKQAVLQYEKMKTLPDDPPGVRWCAPREGVKPPEFAEEVLREVRERPGRDDNHREELERLERRMLDEHFFLYNDVPDTGMCRCRTSTCASIWGVSGSECIPRRSCPSFTGRRPRRHVAAVRF